MAALDGSLRAHWERKMRGRGSRSLRRRADPV